MWPFSLFRKKRTTPARTPARNTLPYMSVYAGGMSDQQLAEVVAIAIGEDLTQRPLERWHLEAVVREQRRRVVEGIKVGAGRYKTSMRWPGVVRANPSRGVLYGIDYEEEHRRLEEEAAARASADQDLADMALLGMMLGTQDRDASGDSSSGAASEPCVLAEAPEAPAETTGSSSHDSGPSCDPGTPADSGGGSSSSCSTPSSCSSASSCSSSSSCGSSSCGSGGGSSD
jgi:hypothetical protein